MLSVQSSTFLQELFKVFPQKQDQIKVCLVRFQNRVNNVQIDLGDKDTSDTTVITQLNENRTPILENLNIGGKEGQLEQTPLPISKTSNNVPNLQNSNRQSTLVQNNSPLDSNLDSAILNLADQGAYEKDGQGTDEPHQNNQNEDFLKVTVEDQILALPDFQVFLDDVRTTVAENDKEYLQFIKGYQDMSEVNTNFKDHVNHLERQCIERENELEMKLNMQGVDTKGLPVFNIPLLSQQMVNDEYVNGLVKIKGDYSKDFQSMIFDPNTSITEDITGQNFQTLFQSCWILLTNQKPATQQFEALKKELGHPQDKKNLTANSNTKINTNQMSHIQVAVKSGSQIQSNSTGAQFNQSFKNEQVSQQENASFNSGEQPSATKNNGSQETIIASFAGNKTNGKEGGANGSKTENGPRSSSRACTLAEQQNMTFIQQPQQITTILPQKRYGHSATVIDNKLYIFGGAYKKGNGQSAFHSFYECSLKLDSCKDDLFKWKRIQGEAPRQRDSHSCISFLNQIIIFGGSCNSQCFNDVYKYDINTKFWTKLDPINDKDNQPTSREGHIAVLIQDDKMLVHGGINDNQECYDDAYILVGLHKDIDQAQSEIIYDESGKIQNQIVLKNRRGRLENLRWFKCKQEGDVPSARDSHSATLAHNAVYVFGGQDNEENLLNDFYKMTLSQDCKDISNIQNGSQISDSGKPQQDRSFTLTWQKIIYKKDLPWPVKRSSHSVNLVFDRFLVLIGGETSNDEQVPINDKKYVRKDKQITLSVVENSKEDDVEVDVSVKESEKSEASLNRSLNDVWLFDLHLNEWKEINPSVKVQSSFNNKKLRKTFEPRMAHSTNLVGNYLVIFGGFNSHTNQYSHPNLNLLSLVGCTDYILQKSFTIQMVRQNVISLRQQQNMPKTEVSKKYARKTQSLASEDKKSSKGQTLGKNSVSIKISNGNQQSNEKQNKVLIPTQACTDSLIRNKSQAPQQITQKSKELQTMNNDGNKKCHFQQAFVDEDEHRRLNLQMALHLASQIKYPIQVLMQIIRTLITNYEMYYQLNERNEPKKMVVNRYEFEDLDVKLKYNHAQKYIHIQDNGPGMTHTELKYALTGEMSGILRQHEQNRVLGTNIMWGCLKLAKNALVITRTMQLNTHQLQQMHNEDTQKFRKEAHIALLSTQFMADSSSKKVVCPLVSFVVKKKKALDPQESNIKVEEDHLFYEDYELIPVTPLPDKFINIIFQYARGIFKDFNDLKKYILSESITIDDDDFYKTGTDIYLCDPNLSFEQKEEDILISTRKGHVNSESSFAKFLKYSFIDFPKQINVHVNNKLMDRLNPFNQIIKYVINDENLAIKGKGDDYRYWIIAERKIMEFEEMAKDPQVWSVLEGILVYKGNSFVKRDELAQPSILISHNKKRSLNDRDLINYNQRLHGIIMISENSEKSQLTYDGQDIADQDFLRQIHSDISQSYLEWCQDQINNQEVLPKVIESKRVKAPKDQPVNPQINSFAYQNPVIQQGEEDVELSRTEEENDEEMAQPNHMVMNPQQQLYMLPQLTEDQFQDLSEHDQQLYLQQLQLHQQFLGQQSMHSAYPNIDMAQQVYMGEYGSQEDLDQEEEEVDPENKSDQPEEAKKKNKKGKKKRQINRVQIEQMDENINDEYDQEFEMIQNASAYNQMHGLHGRVVIQPQHMMDPNQYGQKFDFNPQYYYQQQPMMSIPAQYGMQMSEEDMADESPEAENDQSESGGNKNMLDQSKVNNKQNGGSQSSPKLTSSNDSDIKK